MRRATPRLPASSIAWTVIEVVPGGTASTWVAPAAAVAFTLTNFVAGPNFTRYAVTVPVYQSSPGALNDADAPCDGHARPRTAPGGRASKPYTPVLRSS